jgi:hypothetical protein
MMTAETVRVILGAEIGMSIDARIGIGIDVMVGITEDTSGVLGKETWLA